MTAKEIILEVKELLERHLDVYEISHRLKLDADTVNNIINTLNNTLT